MAGDPSLPVGAHHEPDAWKPEGQKERRVREDKAIEVCLSCPVMVQCDAYASSVVWKNGDPKVAEPDGVWGGRRSLERHRALIAARHEVVAAPDRRFRTPQKQAVLRALAVCWDPFEVASAAGTAAAAPAAEVVAPGSSGSGDSDWPALVRRRLRPCDCSVPRHLSDRSYRMTTEIPTPAVSAEDEAAFETIRTDAVLAGRAMSSGQFLAGLIARGELESVARPDKLPGDLFPGVDPVVVQQVWDRAVAVGFHAGRASVAGIHPDELEATRAKFEAMGFAAMAGSVARSRRLVERARMHSGDGEIAREH
ncbi:WhiB family transcriptional regulator [Streptomyces chiangmaiensis]